MTGTSLRALRTQAGFTQQALAAKLRVHWNTVARWERDELPIRAVVALSIRSVCDDVPQPVPRKSRAGRRR